MSKLIAAFNPFVRLSGASIRAQKRRVATSGPRVTTIGVTRTASSRSAHSVGALRGRASTASSVRFWIASALVAVNVSVGLVYLFGVNASVANGFVIKKVTSRLATLQEDNKKLVQRISEANSIAQVQQDLTSQHFVPITTSEFAQTNQFTQAK